MLRLTISRIRKVCAVAFIPRILRGDQCSAAVSSAVIRKAHKTTKSTDDSDKTSAEKSNNVPNYKTSSAAELKTDETYTRRLSKTTDQTDKIANENNQQIFRDKLPLTHRERCQRIIDQAFGKADDTHPDRVLGEQYFSHTVNLEDTRRAIRESEKAKLKLQAQQMQIDNPLLPDDRSQYSIFKMSRELNFKDETSDDIIITDSASAREPDLTKNLENAKGSAEETPPVEEPNLSQAKEDFDKCVNNPEGIEKKTLFVEDAETIEVVKDERKPDLYQKATPTHKPHVPWFLNATTAREPKVTLAKVDTYKFVNNRESAVKKAFRNDDVDTIKLVKDETKPDLHQEATPNNQPHISQVLANTVNELKSSIFAKNDANKCVKNQESVDRKAFYDDDAETMKLVEDERKLDLHQETALDDEPHKAHVLATTANELKSIFAKDDAYECVKNQESVNRKAFCDDDAETMKLVEDERKLDLHQETALDEEPHKAQVLNATTASEPNSTFAKDDAYECVKNQESVDRKAFCETMKLVEDERKLDLHQETALDDEPHKAQVFNATTASERNSTFAKDDAYECVKNQESVDRKAFCETMKLVEDERKLDVHQETALDDEPHKAQVFNATTASEPNSTFAKDDAYECVNNQESVEKKAICNDAATIKLVKDDDLHQEDTLDQETRISQILNATTAKVDEEQLTQKLETIEETPIVEAQKPNIEGFNVTPKVLGNEPTIKCKIIENNQDNTSKADLPGALDEISKRCLNCPIGQIDEMLINEMEKLGMTSRTAQKAPSTPMEDDLVRMDVNHPFHSESPEKERKENARATDSRTPDVIERAEGLRNYEEIVKLTQEGAHDILYPDHIRVQIDPLACKPQEYNPAAVYNSTTKFASQYLSPSHRAAEINNPEKEETIPNSCAPMNKQIDQTSSSQTFSSVREESVEDNVLSKTAQNAQTTAVAVEAEKPSAEDINTNVTSVDPLNDATDNIRRERFLKPECSSCSKGINKPSYYTTINASKSVGDENQTPAEKELDKNKLYSRNLAANNVWGHYQTGSDQNLPKETDKVEHHGQTPISRSTAEEREGLEEEGQNTANRLFEKVPYNTNLSWPGTKLNKENEHLSTEEKLAQQCSNNFYLTNKSQPKPEQDTENASLPDEIFNQHRLDPYYVLTCNETCPISPGPASSVIQNSDFVDTTETLYMKKNICESVRPKPQPNMSRAYKSSATQAHPNELNLELKPKTVPEIKFTSTEQMTLSELLRLTREKSRLAYSKAKSGLDVQAAGKSSNKNPCCLPPRAPPGDPVLPPSFGLPKLKRRPPVCKPPKKKPSNKCCCATYEDFPEISNGLNETDFCIIRTKVNLTEEVIDRLQNLGMTLGRVLRQSKSNVEMLLARDYEPWTPIPSWKIPPKVEKKQWQPAKPGVPPCVKGCPIFPKARASMRRDPPCNELPCGGFPKRTSFSMLDCFTVSLGENKVYDLGEF